MTLIEAIRKELDTLENHPKIKNSKPMLREDFGALMICVMYGDGKIHHILPPKPIVIKFVDDLVNIIKNNQWEQARKNFEEQIMEPLISEGDFKL